MGVAQTDGLKHFIPILLVSDCPKNDQNPSVSSTRPGATSFPAFRDLFQTPLSCLVYVAMLPALI